MQMTNLRTFLTTLCTVLALSSGALATSKDNVELIGKHFESLGAVRFQAFAPLGGPEIGVAEIRPGMSAPKAKQPEAAPETEAVAGNYKLVAVRADKGKIE